MRKDIPVRFRTLVFAAVILASLLTPSALRAVLSNRVFVSQRSGNDSNNCASITTPCQSFAGAVIQLNPGGEVIVLDTGGYGAVTITQSVTIEAPAGVLAFVHPASGDAITINAGGSDTVILRGLVLNGGSGNGITVNTVGVLHVEGCVISAFTGNGLNFLAGPSQFFVLDTIVRANGGDGIDVAPASGTVKGSVDHCRLEINGVYGIASTGSATSVSIRDSVASGNLNTGLYATGVTGELNVESCLVANNVTGVGVGSGSGLIRLSNSTVTDNTTGLSTTGGSILTRTNNTLEGNGTEGSFTGSYVAQ